MKAGYGCCCNIRTPCGMISDCRQVNDERIGARFFINDLT
jgi:hypothetical protein